MISPTPSCSRLVLLLLALLSLSVSRAPAQIVVGTVPTGNNPGQAALNPVTNQIYVTNENDGTVTIINGANNTASTVTVGSRPDGLAVNSVTNRIYVANRNSNTVSVINGANNTVLASVAVGVNPFAVAINPATNLIYVVNEGSNSVTVINGANNSTSTVPVGSGPTDVVLNPVTNTIYAVNQVGNSVTVINGATNTVTATIPTGPSPLTAAVNPVTNMIYVTIYGGYTTGDTLTVINGATNTIVATLNAGYEPLTVAVNPVTNMAYVSDQNSGAVTVINGANNSIAATIAGQSSGPGVVALAINSLTNTIYVTNATSTVAIINGVTNTVSTITAGNTPIAVAVNPATDVVYVVNGAGNNVSVIDPTPTNAATVAVGSSPMAIAVNPVTNMTYIANNGSSSVTAINGATNAAKTINAGSGSQPQAVAVNPVTNKIYVANINNATVAVINGPNNSTSFVNVGADPSAIAVNPVTNKIYVACQGAGVSVINGADNSVTANVSTGSFPFALAVNPATNIIYAANSQNGTVAAINGVDNSVSAIITVGPGPHDVAVNPITNKIYVANEGGNTVSVIDGASNSVTATIPAGGVSPVAVAVNPVTNQIYVADYGSGTVTVINGANNSASAVTVGTNPNAVTVNSTNNKIYVANSGSNNVTVIDGATNTPATIAAGTNPTSVAVNSLTGEVYVANNGSSNVTVLTSAISTPTALFTSITPLPGNVTYSSTPIFSFEATSLFSPIAPPPDAILYQVDTITGPWNLLTPSNGSATTSLVGTLTRGRHTLFAFATDGQEATSVNPSGTSVAGAMSAYAFVYGDSTPFAAAQIATVVKGSSTAVTLSGSGVNPLTYTVVTAPANGTLSGTAPNLTYTTNNASYIGPDSFTFIVNDGVQNSAPATVTVNIIDDVPVANGQSLGTNRGAPVTVTLTGTALDPLTFSVVTPPANGALSGTPPQLTYTPNAAFAGNDSFTFQVSDGLQNSAPASVTIAVIETPPVAAPQTVAVVKGNSTAIALAATGFSPLSYSLVTPPAHGALTGTAPNLTYTSSDAVYIGADSFTFTVNDGLATSPPATVTINITDDLPVANDQSLGTYRGAPVDVTLTGTAYDPITYSVATQPANGALSGIAPNLVYTPNASFVGNDSFTFVVNDGFENSASATISIAVVETGAPVAAAQNLTVERGSQIGITLGGSSTFPLTYAVDAIPAHGSLAGTAPSLTYIASATYAGPDSFTFTASDGVKTSPPATVSISVLDSPPAAVDDVYYTASNNLGALTLDVLANDSDAEGRALAITAVSRASEGQVSVAPNGQTLIYRPNVRFALSGLPDTFTYTITNGDKTATARVTLVNPFYHHHGNFDGLVVNGALDAGYLAVTLSDAGSFSASLDLDGQVSRFHGAFDGAGNAVVTIHRTAPRSSVTVQLQFNEAAGNTISASLTDGSASYSGSLQAQNTVSALNPVLQAGHYTVIIPAPTPASTSVPGGNGFALLKVAPAGVVQLTGVLGDATPFSCAAYLKADGSFPIYVPLNVKTSPGSLWGSAAFADEPNQSDLSADLQWNKAAQPSGALYRSGFSTQVTLQGSLYLAPKNAQALDFTNPNKGDAQVYLAGGSLSSEQSASVSAKNAITAALPNLDHLHLAISAETGLLTGKFQLSASAKNSAPISGVLIQKQNRASGLFTSPSFTGSFTLEPQ